LWKLEQPSSPVHFCYQKVSILQRYSQFAFSASWWKVVVDRRVRVFSVGKLSGWAFLELAQTMEFTQKFARIFVLNWHTHKKNSYIDIDFYAKWSRSVFMYRYPTPLSRWATLGERIKSIQALQRNFYNLFHILNVWDFLR